MDNQGYGLSKMFHDFCQLPSGAVADGEETVLPAMTEKARGHERIVSSGSTSMHRVGKKSINGIRSHTDIGLSEPVNYVDILSSGSSNINSPSIHGVML